MYLLTVVFSLVSIDVVVLVGGDPLGGRVLDAGLVLSLRHPLEHIRLAVQTLHSQGISFYSLLGLLG